VAAALAQAQLVAGHAARRLQLPRLESRQTARGEERLFTPGDFGAGFFRHVSGNLVWVHCFQSLFYPYYGGSSQRRCTDVEEIHRKSSGTAIAQNRKVGTAVRAHLTPREHNARMVLSSVVTHKAGFKHRATLSS